MENIKDYGISENPFETFKQWHQEALEAEINANAFSFATASKEGIPNNRYLLYKGIHEGQFKIFGSRYSQKAKDLEQVPKGAMAFFWPSSMRQVRIVGEISPMPIEEVKNYFFSRDYKSQVASSISKQSTPLNSRDELEQKFKQELSSKESNKIEFPQFWCGWYLKPTQFEFFIYREHRLNDRFQFNLNKNNNYDICRLWP